MSDHALETPPAPTTTHPTSPEFDKFVNRVVGERSGNTPVEHAGSVTDSAIEDHSSQPHQGHRPKPSHLVDDPLGSKSHEPHSGDSLITQVLLTAASFLAVIAIILSIVAIRKDPNKELWAELDSIRTENQSLKKDLGTFSERAQTQAEAVYVQIEGVKKLAEAKSELDIDAVLANPAVVAKMNETVSAKIAEARAMIIADASTEAMYTLIGGGFKLDHGGDPVVLMVNTTEDGRVNFFITPDTTSAPASAEVASEVPTSDQ